MKYPQDYINKVIQGDCLEVMKDIPDDSIDLVLTDIPYDMVSRESDGLRNLDKGCADILRFNLEDFMEETLRITRGSVYIFCGFGQISYISVFLKDSSINPRLIIWEKTNPSPINGKKTWLSGIEPCIFGKKPKATFNASCRNTVLRYKTGKSQYGHPTEKSVELFKDLIKTSTNTGNLVFDPCLGSGTTAVAAQQLGRKFIGIELEKKYCDMAKERLKQQVLL